MNAYPALKLAIVGLGYVGLPLAVEFAKTSQPSRRRILRAKF